MSRVDEILENYSHRNPGVRSKLYDIMNTGKLAGTGKFVILPVDQGFEHGPARAFQPNPPAYDPSYHPQLAIDGGCNAYAAPLGFIEEAADEYLGEIPLILKANNNDSLYPTDSPMPAVNSTVDDALRLGCHAVGFTIYPGTATKNTNYQQLRDVISYAHDVGLPAVVWSYPRGPGIPKKSQQTAVDVVAYGAQIAAQMGADIIKVKPPTDGIGLKVAERYYDDVNTDTLKDRVSHVIQAAFNNKRIVIFSGGSAKEKDAVLEEIKQIHEGGGYGSIIGRNTFQRPKEESIQLLDDIMSIYKS